MTALHLEGGFFLSRYSQAVILPPQAHVEVGGGSSIVG